MLVLPKHKHAAAIRARSPDSMAGFRFLILPLRC